MKRFISCFLIVTVIIVALNFPAVQEKPLEVVFRILFYFGLPCTFLLAAISLFLEELDGKFSRCHNSLKPAKAAANTLMQKAA